jgi:predicted nucleic acid-binding protein
VKLLDTCVISDLVSKSPNPVVVKWVDAQDDDDIYLSVITIGEIVKGIEKLPTSRRKQELHDWLKHDLLARFQGRILVLDIDVLVEWGTLTAKMELAGRPMPAIDSLIAATALVNHCTFVTRNVSDFEDAGVEIINPSEQ